VFLAFLLARTSLLGSLLACSGSLDRNVGDTFSGIGENVSEEVDTVSDQVAEFGGSEEKGEELVKGSSGLLDFLL